MIIVIEKCATYSSEFQLGQNKEIQFTEDSSLENDVDNEDIHLILFILNDDNVTFNCNVIQSGKRKVFNCDQNYFHHHEHLKNVNYAFQGEYGTKFQKQENCE